MSDENSLSAQRSKSPWGAIKEHDGYRIHGPDNDSIARGLTIGDVSYILVLANNCQLANARNAALEEAAKLADDYFCGCSDPECCGLPDPEQIAAAIRALKSGGGK